MIEVRNGVFVAECAAIPVLRDAFCAGIMFESARAVAGDGEEGFEDVLVENAFRVYGRVVGHEAEDEGGGGLGDEDAGDGAVEEVWIFGDGLLEAALAVLKEDGKVIVCGCGVRLQREEIFPLGHDEFEGVTAVRVRLGLERLVL